MALTGKPKTYLQLPLFFTTKLKLEMDLKLYKFITKVADVFSLKTLTPLQPIPQAGAVGQYWQLLTPQSIPIVSLHDPTPLPPAESPMIPKLRNFGPGLLVLAGFNTA
ncbi:hypothetical protein VNO78_04026 [Psophocarpus tetragonolobus]|uniref:Uncharacterized protein n=1 Tax=Psophocarpus tetragonolobus TaxID=3891 RepID=A0AAN9XWF5_PSOTE